MPARIPGCLGNCHQGRRACTLPGVCQRVQRRRTTPPPQVRLTRLDIALITAAAAVATIALGFKAWALIA